jgi:hypothetical protein
MILKVQFKCARFNIMYHTIILWGHTVY